MGDRDRARADGAAPQFIERARRRGHRRASAATSASCRGSSCAASSNLLDLRRGEPGLRRRMPELGFEPTQLAAEEQAVAGRSRELEPSPTTTRASAARSGVRAGERLRALPAAAAGGDRRRGSGGRALRPVQELAGEAILDGKNAVVLAPTAGGKTEASMFPALARLVDEPPDGVGAIYIAPIKALLNNQAERLGHVHRDGRAAPLRLARRRRRQREAPSSSASRPSC